MNLYEPSNLYHFTSSHATHDWKETSIRAHLNQYEFPCEEMQRHEINENDSDNDAISLLIYLAPFSRMPRKSSKARKRRKLGKCCRLSLHLEWALIDASIEALKWPYRHVKTSIIWQRIPCYNISAFCSAVVSAYINIFFLENFRFISLYNRNFQVFVKPFHPMLCQAHTSGIM